MKTKFLILLALALIVSAQEKAKRSTIERIANAYFRHGEQAALIALSRDKSIQTIDDPRIFQTLKDLNGSYLGLDTNSWVLDMNKGTNEFADWVSIK